MNKADLVEAIARHLGSSKAEAERALEAFTGSVTAGLKKGEPGTHYLELLPTAHTTDGSRSICEARFPTPCR